jgi:hypothetical protein
LTVSRIIREFTQAAQSVYAADPADPAKLPIE